ncbi:hypothetical protein [Actinoplanes solisilvae]|nr:hypothetical protein [Actinoplanes solisilvae]
MVAISRAAGGARALTAAILAILAVAPTLRTRQDPPHGVGHRR